jgi:signal transduction histidine kinase
LEDEYLRVWHEKNGKWITGSLILALLMLIVLSPLDKMYVTPAETLRHFQQVRFLVWVPSIMLGLLVTLAVKQPRIFQPIMAILGLYTGACLTTLLLIAGVPAIDYVTILACEVLLFLFFMIGLPFRWALIVSAVISVGQVAAVVYLRAPAGQLWFSVGNLTVMTSLLATTAHRLESGARKNFVAEIRISNEHSQRLAAQSDRARWLETIADFLSHELNNSMIGIDSSLKLAEGTVQIQHPATQYLDRAQRSLGFMRRFLQQAAEATSLEMALVEQEMETIDLTELLRSRVRDYAQEHSRHIFDLKDTSGISISGNADRIVQMLDKLINNAVEHSTGTHPIEIGARVAADSVEVSIKNFGDSLPDSLDHIFEPFVSQKPKRSKGNLGLGLYVARVIVNRHVGTIEARRLDANAGAEFCVTLPLIK